MARDRYHDTWIPMAKLEDEWDSIVEAAWASEPSEAAVTLKEDAEANKERTRAERRDRNIQREDTWADTPLEGLTLGSQAVSAERKKREELAKKMVRIIDLEKALAAVENPDMGRWERWGRWLAARAAARAQNPAAAEDLAATEDLAAAEAPAEAMDPVEAIDLAKAIDPALAADPATAAVKMVEGERDGVTEEAGRAFDAPILKKGKKRKPIGGMAELMKAAAPSKPAKAVKPAKVVESKHNRTNDRVSEEAGLVLNNGDVQRSRKVLKIGGIAELMQAVAAENPAKTLAKPLVKTPAAIVSKRDEANNEGLSRIAEEAAPVVSDSNIKKGTTKKEISSGGMAELMKDVDAAESRKTVGRKGVKRVAANRDELDAKIKGTGKVVVPVSGRKGSRNGEFSADMAEFLRAVERQRKYR